MDGIKGDREHIHTLSQVQPLQEIHTTAPPTILTKVTTYVEVRFNYLGNVS